MFNRPMNKTLKNFGVIGGFAAATLIFMYPIFFYPIMNVDKYKQIQAVNRKNIDQEAVQPGGMKIWSDPYGRK